MQTLQSHVSVLRGITPKQVELLKREIGVDTLGDLIGYYPYRYEDRTQFLAIRDLQESNGKQQVIATLQSTRMAGEGRKRRLEAVFSDDSGMLACVWFRGLQWVYKQLKIGVRYVLFGGVEVYGHRLSMSHPSFEVFTPAVLQRAGLDPLYETTERMKVAKLQSTRLAVLIREALELVQGTVEDYLPSYLVEEHRLPELGWALASIHFPADRQALKLARARLVFDELFTLQISLLRNRIGADGKQYAGQRCTKSGVIIHEFYSRNLPFELTEAQRRVVHEIYEDMRSGLQMSRLIQGDVGSGKTLVALCAMLVAAGNGMQSALMAPTEILAQQHYKSISKFIKGLGIVAALLTGSTPAKARTQLLKGLENGAVQLLIGTHALIEDRVQFQNLGLIVVDEQQRFGVDQRARLWGKGAKYLPHILVMTATPIPRTLAMALYGDLQISVIDELPPGRKPIVTVHCYKENRGKLYGWVEQELRAGRQAYFVYPLIEESATLDLESLEVGYQSLKEVYPHYQVAMVHGRMPPEEKEAAMQAFASGKAQILVSTTVIEVGVDVPNASVMVIEEAQRFGLSQLHQLRGRVGRGAEKSYCFLVTDYKLGKESKVRIDTMVQTNDGFKIAEVDLNLRGAGDLEGTQQSGIALRLRLANLATDGTMLNFARTQAEALLARDPKLEFPEHRLLAARIEAEKNRGGDYSKIG